MENNNNLQKTLLPEILFTISCFVVLTAIIAGIIITGGPEKQRKIRLDEKRVNIIRNLSYEIRSYYNSNSKLPSNLNFISDSTKFSDPKTNKLPDYSIINDTKFKICTKFETSSFDLNKTYSYDYNIKHPSGYFCAIYEKTKDKYVFFKLVNNDL